MTSPSSRVPTNDSLGPGDSQRVYNARNQAVEPDQHQSIEGAENKSLGGIAPQHVDLLPENQDLCLKPRPRAKQADER